MKTLLIVYYSMTGGSEQLARASHDAAAAEEGLTVKLQQAQACQNDEMSEEMLAADGYIFVCPENLAALAGGMKMFFDAQYYPLLGRIEGRPYAAMICAGSDGTNARAQLQRICTGWRLKPVMDTPIICTHAQSEVEILAPKTINAMDLAKAHEMGATLAAGIAMGVF